MLGNDHPDTLLDVYNLGTIHDRMGRFDSAEHLYKSAVADMGRVLGKTHRWTCLAQQRLASLYARQKRFEESETCALAAYRGIQRGVWTEPRSDARTGQATLGALRSVGTAGRDGQVARADAEIGDLVHGVWSLE